MSVLMWQYRGPDADGADNWVGTTLGQSFLVTKDRHHGVRLWKLSAGKRELVGVGFNNVEAAKSHAPMVAA